MRRSTALVLFAVFGLAREVRCDQIFVTDFTKSNNIYTNINHEFPHTDSDNAHGVDGSTVGTANSSFLFDPTPSAVISAGYAPDYLGAGSNKVNNGIDFKLTSNSLGKDFDEILGTTLDVTTNIDKATAVYALMGAYNTATVNVTFTGQDGHTETFSNIFLPDFNGGTVNSTSATLKDQTVFQVHDVGAGGTGNASSGDVNNYDLTEVSFTLDSTLANETLTSISFTVPNSERGLLYGITADAAPLASTPLPGPVWGGLVLMGMGAYGRVMKRRIA
jgi:hypothetical protein